MQNKYLRRPTHKKIQKTTMKKMLLAAAAATVLFASCKKDKTATSDNTWKIGTTSYSGSVTVSGATITGSSSGTTTASIFEANFAVLPTVSGTYNIVAFATDSNEVDITTGTGSLLGGSFYGSTGNDHKTATVTVTNGKVKVTIPEISVAPTLGSSATDSTTASGVLVQP